MSGFSCGTNYKPTMTHDGLVAWHESPRRRSNLVANNTSAARDADGGFTICLHWTNIARVLPGNVVEIDGSYDSMLTRSRVNALLDTNGGRCRLWSDRETGYGVFAFTDRWIDMIEPRSGKTWKDRFCFMIPAKRGASSAFVPTVVDVYLCAGARLGDVQACDALTASLDARGFDRMADVFRSYRGKRWGSAGQIKALKAFYGELKFQPYSTDAQRELGPRVEVNGEMVDGPSLAEQGYSSGIGLLDAVTGEPMRVLTMHDVIVCGVDPMAVTDVTIEGKFYRVVTDYAAAVDAWNMPDAWIARRAASLESKGGAS